jgi:hypothetical protein
MVNDLDLVNGVISLTYNLLVVKGPMTVGTIFERKSLAIFMYVYDCVWMIHENLVGYSK